MPVHIGSLETEVVAEPRPQAAADGAAAPLPDWRAVAEARALRARLHRDALRVRAEGFDD